MIGIIGGTGLEDPKILKDFEERKVKTAFGEPSSPITVGKLNGIQVAIISRHGKTHSINPSNVPYKANILALKELDCHTVLASTACGSLREEIKPGNLVFPDQFIDWTHRPGTFYDLDKVCHIPMAEPFCPEIRKALIETARQLKIPHHEKGTVITIEGPRFSTKAESKMYRLLGADIVNMSTVPEVVLAREAGMCYQAIAMATDYDCWRESEEAVNIKMVIKRMKENAENVKKIFLGSIAKIDKVEKSCNCETAVKSAVI
ncbi:MAG: S-methyl-5'-thioadenosine phosphorylase [Candidatus Diapherotrites archaeon]|nr:S-methyl-5'-thioadenosine phosphorylase [Candidatus Diapherotrites archaeon]